MNRNSRFSETDECYLYSRCNSYTYLQSDAYFVRHSDDAPGQSMESSRPFSILNNSRENVR